MKPIYIFCLHGVRTGGPEAIHQLSDALIEQGFDARFVYYDWNQIAALEQAPAQVGYRFGMRANPIEEYAHYKINIVAEAPNDPDAIIVLPETLCHLAPKFDRATVLIWWLSVDNGFGALAKVNVNHLRSVKHAAQSYYASDFCNALGLRASRLSDYTTSLSAYATPLPWESRQQRIAINANPHKVTADLDDLILKIGEDAQCVRIARFDRATVAHTFATSRLYIDLGSFPGKDRMPREAANMGCAVLCSERALKDFPFADGVCLANIWNALKAPPKPYDIATERLQFWRETKVLFSSL